MTFINKITEKVLHTIPVIIGVTFLSFLLMVYFSPDQSYELAGKNPTKEQIESIRDTLGYNRPILIRYGEYLYTLVKMDFGISDYWSKPVNQLLWERIPVSVMLILPGFLIGNVIALFLAMLAAQYRGKLLDRAIMIYSFIGMSISFLIVMITFQIFFSSSDGLNLFPVRGWEITNPEGDFSWPTYLYHVTVPSLIMITVSLGYNTRFYRAVFIEYSEKQYIMTAHAFGYRKYKVWFTYLLKNTLIPIMTRILFSLPMLVIGGSLLLESFFGIPGIGLLTYDAIISVDQKVLLAITSLTAVLFVFILFLSELCYEWIDPRLSKSNQKQIAH